MGAMDPLELNCSPSRQPLLITRCADPPGWLGLMAANPWGAGSDWTTLATESLGLWLDLHSTRP